MECETANHFMVNSKLLLFLANMGNQKILEIKKQTIFRVKSKPFYLFKKIIMRENIRNKIANHFLVKSKPICFFQITCCFVFNNSHKKILKKRNNGLFFTQNMVCFSTSHNFFLPHHESLQKIKVVC